MSLLFDLLSAVTILGMNSPYYCDLCTLERVSNYNNIIMNNCNNRGKMQKYQLQPHDELEINTCPVNKECIAKLRSKCLQQSWIMVHWHGITLK